MDFFIEAIQLALGMLGGFIISISVSTIGCCLFCGIPISRILMNHRECIRADKMSGMYWKSIVLHTMIVGASSWAMIRFAPKNSQVGFFCAIFLSVLLGCGKWGMNIQNVSESMDKAWNHVEPGKEEDAKVAIDETILAIAEKKAENISVSVLRSVVATLIIWLGGRALPGVLLGFFSFGPFVMLAVSFMALFASWYLACSVTKWSSPKTIRYNMYAIVIFEMGTFWNCFTRFLNDASLWSGIALAVVALYIFLCIWFGKNAEKIAGNRSKNKKNKDDRSQNKIAPTWVILCVAVMLITAFAVLYSGMSSKIETEREEAYQEGYEEGYGSGYDSGITDGEYKLKTYKSKNNSPDGNSVKEISVYVKNQYGITPSEAAEIVCKYNNPDGSGYPTWAVYQNALLALVYAGGLIGY